MKKYKGYKDIKLIQNSVLLSYAKNKIYKKEAQKEISLYTYIYS